jgi:hypothetical protein
MDFYFLRKKNNIFVIAEVGSCCDQQKLSSSLAIHAAGHWMSRQLSCQQILQTCAESSTVTLYDLLMI